jgi:hypothetical protein
MKVFRPLVLISGVIVSLLLFSCFDPESDSDGIQRLVIENAFYHNTLTGCIIEFDYYITEDTCKVSGWGIDYGNGHGGFVDWYMPQTCEPGVRYSIKKESRTIAVLPPIIGMQGYWYENDTLLTWDAKKTLIPK